MSLEDALRRRAKVWASTITKEAHRNLGKYRNLIRVQSKVVESKGKVAVESTASPTSVSEYGDVKNVARAYEYGSGLHGKYKRKYIIAPKRKKVLAFFWDKLDGDPPGTWYGGGKLIKKTAEGKGIFRYVEHPGVRAANNGKGYLRPAVNKVRAQIRKEIPAEVRKETIGIFRKAFAKR